MLLDGSPTTSVHKDRALGQLNYLSAIHSNAANPAHNLLVVSSTLLTHVTGET